MVAPHVVHSARKIRATIGNARELLALEATPGLASYLQSFHSYDELASDLRSRFAFMGPMNVWYVLFRVREPVPPFDSWVRTIQGEHPRMREMVEAARAAGLSSETEAERGADLASGKVQDAARSSAPAARPRSTRPVSDRRR